MKILCLECSATPASVALLQDGKILSSAYCHVKLTHSQTLLPMVDQVLKQSLTDIGEIDGIAVSAGPGSFTGIRIGISAVKGLAAARNLPCVGVSSLEAMTVPFHGQNGIVCGVMDARCQQVYNALFRVENGTVTRLCDDRALMCEELVKELEKLPDDLPVFIVGDGAELFYPFVEHFHNTVLADALFRYQNATGVGFCAEAAFTQNRTVPAAELLPVYLRLPQAERELKQRQKERKSEK